jgi:putative transposase
MIDLGCLLISIRRQCELIGLHRSTFYHVPATASAFNLQLMRLIDEQYTKMPLYGWPRRTAPGDGSASRSTANGSSLPATSLPAT